MVSPMMFDVIASIFSSYETHDGYYDQYFPLCLSYTHILSCIHSIVDDKSPHAENLIESSFPLKPPDRYVQLSCINTYNLSNDIFLSMPQSRPSSNTSRRPSRSMVHKLKPTQTNTRRMWLQVRYTSPR